MEPRDTTGERLLSELLGGRNNNRTEVHINAGGIGVWIATSACCVMLAINIGLGVLLVNHDRKLDELNNYLNAIYMMAPHLKPEKKSE